MFTAGFHTDVQFRSFSLVYHNNSLIVYSPAGLGSELWRRKSVDFMLALEVGSFETVVVGLDLSRHFFFLSVFPFLFSILAELYI